MFCETLTSVLNPVHASVRYYQAKGTPVIMASNKDRLNEVENEMKEKYIEIVRSLSLDELTTFNKFHYKNLVAEEMAHKLPEENMKTIQDTAHYISNALNNEAQAQRGQKRKENQQNSENQLGKMEEPITQNPRFDETLDSTFSSTQLDDTYEDAGVNGKDNKQDESITEIKTAIRTRRSLSQKQQKLAKKQKSKPKPVQTTKHRTSEKEDIICVDDCEGDQNGDMIRCNLCMVWYHTKCVSCDNSIGCWTCLKCRKMPDNVSMICSLLQNMQEQNNVIAEQISSLSSSLENKLSLINDRITSLSNQEKCRNLEHNSQITDLKEDISYMKQEVNKNVNVLLSKTQTVVDSIKVIKSNTSMTKLKQTSPTEGKETELKQKSRDDDKSESQAKEKPNYNPNTKTRKQTNTQKKPKLTLITGSNTLKGIDPRRLKQNVRVKTFFKATIESLTQELSQMDLSVYETVVIHVGEMDIANKLDVEAFKSKYKELISLVTKTSKVIISGLLPRETHDVQHYNHALSDICISQKIQFIENHNTFILASGEIPRYYFHPDKTNLKPYGTARLLSNINSKCSIFRDKSNDTPQMSQFPNQNRWHYNGQVRSNRPGYKSWNHRYNRWGTQNNPIQIHG